jgi:hypothetical protein
MRKHKCWRTDFLFAQPSFCSGFGRTLDLHGHYVEYNQSQTGEEADMRALVCDWLVIQQDLDECWTKIIDQNPVYLEALTNVIKADPYLRDRVLRTVKKEHGLEMATQGA